MYLGLLYVVQVVVALLVIIRKKLTANEEGVVQTLCFVNVAKNFLRLYVSFVTLDMRKLVIREVEADDEHYYASLVYFLYYFFNISALEGGAFLELSTMSQRSMDDNIILILDFQRLKFLPLNSSMVIAAPLSNNVIVGTYILSRHSNLYFLAYNQSNSK